MINVIWSEKVLYGKLNEIDHIIPHVRINLVCHTASTSDMIMVYEKTLSCSVSTVHFSFIHYYMYDSSNYHNIHTHILNTKEIKNNILGTPKTFVIL